MKKFYSFFALLMCTLFSLTATAQESESTETGTATVNISGKFFTFSVQDTNKSGAEAELYSVAPAGEEINDSKTINLDAEEVEVRLIGQAEGNAFYVTLDGKKVVSTSQDNFEAVVTLKNGSVLNVANASEYAATISINGKFYTFSVQDNHASGKDAELYSVVPGGEEINETKTIELNEEEVEVRLIGQAEGNAFYVTLDGQKVVSSSTDSFDAVVKLKNNSVLNVANASEYAATINIKGAYYTFSIQDTNAAGKAAELYSVTPDGAIINETATFALGAEEVEVRLIGQNADNRFYVTLDGKKVVSTSADSFEAVVTLKNNSVLNVANASDYAATLNLNGKFYTFSVQDTNASGKEAELYSVTPAGEEINETAYIELNAEEVEVRLIGQAEGNAFYVTLDGKKVVSTSQDNFEAVVTLKSGSILNVANASEYAATISINGKFYTFAVQDTNASGKDAELFSVTPGGEEINETKTIELNAEEVEVRLVGQAEGNAFYVTLDGKKVVSTSEDNFEAVVTLKNGSKLNVANAAEYAATININGKFFTFSVQDTNAAGKDAELFSVTPGGEEINETATIELGAEEVEVRLVGQAEGNAFYVTINGKKVVSTSEDNFEAVVTLKAGDVINVTNASEYAATININGKFFTFAVQDTKAEGKDAELYSVVPAGEEIKETKTIALGAEAVEVRLVGQAPENAFYVTLNGTEIASTSEYGFEAVVTLKAGDVLNIANDKATAINTVNAVVANAKAYNMQGMEVKANKPGLYIINGKKVMVK